MRAISVINQKGGVGKTTSVINVGAALAKLGKKVLIVDLDPQGNLSSGLGVSDEITAKRNIYFALVSGQSLAQNTIRTRIENLYIVPSDNNLAGAEVELVSVEGREYRLRDSFCDALKHFDYVFIDCPPSLGLLTINALSASDSYLIPMQSEFFALQGLTNIVKTASLVKRHLNKKLRQEGILLTMFDSRSNLSKQVYKEIKDFAGDRLFRTVIPRRIRLAESTSHGVPGVIYDSSCLGSRSYMEIAKEILFREKGVVVEEEKKTEFVPPDPVDRFGKARLNPVPQEI